MTTLGFVERSCSKCGRQWRMERGECECGSHELVERFHEPSLVERVGGAIRAVVIPAQPKAPRANAAQVASLRALQAAVVQLLADIHAVDASLTSAVRGDVEELIPAQAAVNTALSITGDASPDRAAHLSLALRAFAATLERAIDHIEEPK